MISRLAFGHLATLPDVIRVLREIENVRLWKPVDQVWAFGTAAPTTEAHKVGDKVWNSVPVAGGWIGWVCTVAGTPGTWKTFGAIAP